ncbi:amino acid ABC transporter permease [Nocardioides sp. JQ2195]|uniref:amino acid ABC transporter permease n=1 Tax=Nocardioides sp. JQ2195 TaxID=2592334 RepID=UPI00143E6C27|nr:amino acid ABC transporter permease [Nocardioides sp. JQ2195]QIX27988.1 amino acid ABC transporter permease [Nocardioides sp. JQ2195]
MSSVLYDIPGPRARRRILIGSIIGGLVLVALLGLALKRLSDNGILGSPSWEVLTYPEIWESLGRGLLATLRAAALAAVLAVLLGAVLTALRLSPTRWLSWPAATFTELFRGLPVLLLMFAPFVISTTISPFTAVVIGLTLYNGCIIAEILRSGVVALPSGQREAGLAIGLTPVATLRAIEFPQAVRIMLPTLVSQIVVLLKDTSLGYIVTYEELLTTVKTLRNFYSTSFGSEVLFPIFFAGAVIYILVNMTISQVASWLARRGNKKAARAPLGREDRPTAGGVGGAA